MREVGSRRTGIAIVLLFTAGFWLRWYFVRWHPFVAGDSTLYLDIAQSWIDAHTYGLSTNTVPRPTLIRLPGYPMVLAALQVLVPSAAKAPDGSDLFQLVEWVQVCADLLACALLASLAKRHFGLRAGMAALAMTTLCPFLANYTAVPLTESLVTFLMVLAFWAADLWSSTGQRKLLVLMAAALGYSILLRPDQCLLSAAVLLLFLLPAKGGEPFRWKPALACALLTAVPLVPWTVRNARTFHVFQPLAPKSATDPGEVYARGFQHWYRTFAVDFATTQDAYWNYPEIAVDPNDLPSRAFDNADERRRAGTLLERAGTVKKLEPAVEAGFQNLADERMRAHPLRSYVVLPAARLVNMLLHPRTEMLPVDERWWRFHLHPWQTAFAYAYALLNVGYMLLAIMGLPRAWRLAPALTASMCVFVLLRCALLLTLDNAEQRYTLEFLPIYMFLGAAFFTAKRETDAA